MFGCTLKLAPLFASSLSSRNVLSPWDLKRGAFKNVCDRFL